MIPENLKNVNQLIIEYVKTKTDPIVLLGITLSGQKFRPSDWAQRLTVAVSTVGPRKQVISHPHVHMALRDGLPAVVIDPVLEQENVIMYEFLINFAKSNDLQIEYPWIGSSRERLRSQEEELRAVS